MRISEKEPGKRFVFEGKTTIKGESIPYQTISEETMIDGKDGNLAACIFSYTYLRTDAKNTKNRPVLFVYNGGPGSSSHLLHVGFFGTDRAKVSKTGDSPVVPPYAVEENPHCILDLCDLVLIDPVETGFGKLFTPEAAGEFFGVEEDAMSLALFIEHWLSKYQRWDSPHFLCGESYGTLRSAVLADLLMGGVAVKRFTGISLNGIIMMGSTFHVEESHGPLYVEPTVLKLPSYAAANHYHNKITETSLEDFVEEAYQFSVGEYAHALLLGDYMTPAEKSAATSKLSYFTGLSEDCLRQNGLKPDTKAFLSNVIRDRGLEAGGYDSRVTLPLSDQIGPRDSFDDPSMAKSTPSYTALFHSHFKKKLQIGLDRAYITTNIASNFSWNYKCGRTPAQSLAAAMRRNPNLHVMFATGYFDLCTCAGYARYIISQLGLDQARIYRREYEGGHMIYTNEKAAANLERDIRTFIAQSI
ncbi:hypothetical protein V1225_04015 [Emergencia sp. JLR.KK010]|uniref:S10 family peptidase n=1 Tax=Emergencia sp. JLR.KK010 TaxID=3114296 RepID=UPI0030D252D5